MSGASNDAQMNALPQTRRSGGTMGEGRRPEAVAATDEEPHPEITLREISAWSLAILATVAVGFLLYTARELLLPVVASFVVGIMLGPAARPLEALHVPRPLAALLLVAGVTLIFAFVILLIFPRVSELASGLPGIVASLKEKLHVFDGLVAAWGRLTTMIGDAPRRSKVFFFFSSCSFWSSRNAPTCGAPSSCPSRAAIRV